MLLGGFLLLVGRNAAYKLSFGLSYVFIAINVSSFVLLVWLRNKGTAAQPMLELWYFR
jgi:hypothetical protein